MFPELISCIRSKTCDLKYGSTDFSHPRVTRRPVEGKIRPLHSKTTVSIFSVTNKVRRAYNFLQDLNLSPHTYGNLLEKNLNLFSNSLQTPIFLDRLIFLNSCYILRFRSFGAILNFRFWKEVTRRGFNLISPNCWLPVCICKWNSATCNHVIQLNSIQLKMMTKQTKFTIGLSRKCFCACFFKTSGMERVCYLYFGLRSAAMYNTIWTWKCM